MAKSYKEPRGSRRITYVVCPLCGRNRALETQSKGRLRWDFFDPETSPIIQIREAHGKLPSDQQPSDQRHKPGMAKGGGFPLIIALTWNDILDQAEYPDQIKAIITQIKRISKFLEK
jgi:hypothetical protein